MGGFSLSRLLWRARCNNTREIFKEKKKKGKEKNVSVSTKVSTELAAGTVTKGVLEMEL